jgi:hypothetical protein
MPKSSAGRLLDSWDIVRGEALPVRAAALAAFRCGVPAADAARWSIPRRDVALFDLRAELFGDELDAVSICSACSTPLEMQVALSEIRPHTSMTLAGETFEVVVDGTSISCRRPDTDDLIAASALGDVHAARQLLIERCVDAADPSVRQRAAALLPAEPTDVHLQLTCPACGHMWQTPFDIAAFVWTEIDRWADRTLHEIHVIASAYGWTEDEILSLSARRRAAYVEIIG